MTAVTPSSDPKAYRLPLTVRPQQYDITLDARPGRETFSGSLSVRLSIAAPTSVIELHALELEITHARVTSSNGQTFTASVTPDAEREIAAITLNETAPAGDATLTLELRGPPQPEPGRTVPLEGWPRRDALHAMRGDWRAGDHSLLG